MATFYAKHNLVEKQRLGFGRDDGSRPRLVQIKPSENEVDPAGLVRVLVQDSLVSFAEPNFLLTLSEGPNDPKLADLWGLNNSGQSGGTTDADIDALEAWGITTGSQDVIVGIIDTGVDYSHPDLAGNMWTNPGEIAGNGKDEDGNGYIDDVHGINAITAISDPNTGVAEAGDPMDIHGHGTHTAGTIGAKGNNGQGVVGVNWNVRIVACKFLDSNGGGNIADAAKCFMYFNHLKHQLGVNVVVTNNSWGRRRPQRPVRKFLQLRGYHRGPGRAWCGRVVHTRRGCGLCDPSGYKSLNGTSMATPHVAGAAALVSARYPGLSAAQLKQRLLWGGDYIGGLDGNAGKSTLTKRRLNVYSSLDNDTSAPAAITDLAVSGSGVISVTLSWTASGDDGTNGTASAYEVRYSTSSPLKWDTATPALPAGEGPQPVGSTESFTVSGLDPSNTYYFAVRVKDNLGNESGMSNVISGSTVAGTVVFADDIENGINGWTTGGEPGLWHRSTHLNSSPSTAWYYGIEGTWSYNHLNNWIC